MFDHILMIHFSIMIIIRNRFEYCFGQYFWITLTKMLVANLEILTWCIWGLDLFTQRKKLGDLPFYLPIQTFGFLSLTHKEQGFLIARNNISQQLWPKTHENQITEQLNKWENLMKAVWKTFWWTKNGKHWNIPIHMFFDTSCTSYIFSFSFQPEMVHIVDKHSWHHYLVSLCPRWKIKSKGRTAKFFFGFKYTFALFKIPIRMNESMFSYFLQFGFFQ